MLGPLGMLLLVFFGRFWDFEPFLCFSRVDLDSSLTNSVELKLSILSQFKFLLTSKHFSKISCPNLSSLVRLSERRVLDGMTFLLDLAEGVQWTRVENFLEWYQVVYQESVLVELNGYMLAK